VVGPSDAKRLKKLFMADFFVVAELVVAELIVAELVVLVAGRGVVAKDIGLSVGCEWNLLLLFLLTFGSFVAKALSNTLNDGSENPSLKMEKVNGEAVLERDPVYSLLCSGSLIKTSPSLASRGRT